MLTGRATETAKCLTIGHYQFLIAVIWAKDILERPLFSVYKEVPLIACCGHTRITIYLLQVEIF